MLDLILGVIGAIAGGFIGPLLFEPHDRSDFIFLILFGMALGAGVGSFVGDVLDGYFAMQYEQEILANIEDLTRNGLIRVYVPDKLLWRSNAIPIVVSLSDRVERGLYIGAIGEFGNEKIYSGVKPVKPGESILIKIPLPHNLNVQYAKVVVRTDYRYADNVLKLRISVLSQTVIFERLENLYVAVKSVKLAGELARVGLVIVNTGNITLRDVIMVFDVAGAEETEIISVEGGTHILGVDTLKVNELEPGASAYAAITLKTSSTIVPLRIWINVASKGVTYSYVEIITLQS